MKTSTAFTLIITGILAAAIPASAEFNLGRAIQKGIEISQQQKYYPQPAPQPKYQPKPMPVYQPKPMPTYTPAPVPVPKPTYKPKPVPKPPVPVTPNVSKMVSVLKGHSPTVSSAPTITNRTTQIAPTIAPKGYETFRMKRGRESAEGTPGPPVTTARAKDGRPSAEGAPVSRPGSGSIGRPTPSAPPANLSYRVDTNSQLATSSVRFRKGSTELADQASFQYLQNLASALQDPSLVSNRFVVEGHASADGSDYANLLLSQRRANAIFDFLMSHGVAPDRLLAVGHGESQARFRSGDPEYLLAQDRQVVVFKLAD
ncbi:MAG: OmpA family protein [Verrucomicrobiota bacterium]